MKTTSRTVVKTTTTTTTQSVNKRQHQTAPSKPDSKQGSKGPSAAPSKAQSKKVEVQRVVSSSDGGDIKDAFELFDANDGKINAREIKEGMQNIGFDDNNPTIYQVIAELDNPRNKNAGGASFSDFCQAVNYRVPEKETIEELR